MAHVPSAFRRWWNIMFAGSAGGGSGMLTQTVVDGDTTHTPSGDAVFDAIGAVTDASGAGAIVAGYEVADAVSTSDQMEVTQGDLIILGCNEPGVDGRYTYHGVDTRGNFFYNPYGLPADPEALNALSVLDTGNGYRARIGGIADLFESTLVFVSYANFFDAISDCRAVNGAAGLFTVTPDSRKRTVNATNDDVQRSCIATTITYNNVDVPADTPLAVTVETGGIYDIELTVQSTRAVNTLNMDFGGTASVTNFIGQWLSYQVDDLTTGIGAKVTAAGTDFTTKDSGETFNTFKGSIEVNAGGTFLLRGAQSAADVSDTTILRGSTLVLTKTN